MNKNEFDSLMSDVFSALRLKEEHIKETDSDMTNLDHRLRKELYDNYDYKNLFIELTEQVSLGNPIIYRDMFNSYYFVYQEYTPDIVTASYVVAGPFVYEAYKESDYHSVLINADLPLGKYKDLIAFLSQTTIVPSMPMITSLFNSLLNRQGISNTLIRHISYVHSVIDDRKDDIISLSPKSTSEYTAIEERYKVEAALLEAVMNGDTKAALDCSNRFMKFNLAPRVQDPLRDAQDMVIAVNTLLRKAVENAYVHPLYIDDLNAKLTTEIEAAEKMSDIDRICQTTIRRYCMLVKSYSRANYSELIRNTLNHIDFHYEEPLTLTSLANKFGVTKNYLSAAFHKEVNVTVTDYINSTRIKRSILLLNTSKMNIDQIAEACGFSDANYYARIFKKAQGMSPSEYRKSVQ